MGGNAAVEARPRDHRAQCLGFRPSVEIQASLSSSSFDACTVCTTLRGPAGYVPAVTLKGRSIDVAVAKDSNGGTKGASSSSILILVLSSQSEARTSEIRVLNPPE